MADASDDDDAEEDNDDDDQDHEVLENIANFDNEEVNNDDDANVMVVDDYQDHPDDFSEDYHELVFEEGTDHPDNDANLSHETRLRIFNVRHLVESRGKLFMVKQQLHCLGNNYKDSFTQKVEVFEADISAGAWMPLVGGLGGQALFISSSLVKFVPACGEIEEDMVYFMDTDDVFSIRSQTNRADAQWNCDYRKLMRSVVDGQQWIFPPDLLV
jgi:hypothetical protein